MLASFCLSVAWPNEVVHCHERAEVRVIRDNLQESGQNVKACLILTKVLDSLDCAVNLSTVGVSQMDQDDLEIALGILTDDKRELPWPLKVEATAKYAGEIARHILGLGSDKGNEEPVLKKKKTADYEGMLRKRVADKSLEELFELFWQVFDIRKLSESFAMVDAWDYQEPKFVSLIAILQDSEEKEKAEGEDEEQDEEEPERSDAEAGFSRAQHVSFANDDFCGI